MTTILSWNIQNGLGVDGVLSIERIATTIKGICDPDMICLQEVAINMLLPNDSYADQVSALTQEFDEYTPLFGAAVKVWGTGQKACAQYGNMILSRYPVISAFNHPLPQPADGSKKQMPRQLSETTVQAPSGPLRVMTTHLEFHSQVQRLVQSKRIMAIERDIELLEKTPPLFTDGGPYSRLERSAKSVLCGDFNFLAHSDEYKILTDPAAAQRKLHDVWCMANPGQPYAPTCGIFDRQQWPEGPHCRDFMFVSTHLKRSIQSMFVDTETAASDHQPLVLKLDF